MTPDQLSDRSNVTVTLSRANMQRVYELVVAKAVNLEAAEDVAMMGCGSGDYRKPADAIRAALDEEGAK